jgi:hypothetical protein
MPFVAIFDSLGTKKLHVKNGTIMDLTLFPYICGHMLKYIQFLKKKNNIL